LGPTPPEGRVLIYTRSRAAQTTGKGYAAFRDFNDASRSTLIYAKRTTTITTSYKRNETEPHGEPKRNKVTKTITPTSSEITVENSEGKESRKIHYRYQCKAEDIHAQPLAIHVGATLNFAETDPETPSRSDANFSRNGSYEELFISNDTSITAYEFNSKSLPIYSKIPTTIRKSALYTSERHTTTQTKLMGSDSYNDSISNLHTYPQLHADPAKSFYRHHADGSSHSVEYSKITAPSVLDPTVAETSESSSERSSPPEDQSTQYPLSGPLSDPNSTAHITNSDIDIQPTTKILEQQYQYGHHNEQSILSQPYSFEAIDNSMKARLFNLQFSDWSGPRDSAASTNIGCATYLADYNARCAGGQDLGWTLHYELPKGANPASLPDRQITLLRTARNSKGQTTSTKAITLTLQPGKSSTIHTTNATNDTSLPDGGTVSVDFLPVEISLRATGKIEPEPENDSYDLSKWAGEGDDLGPLPMGKGRAGHPGIAYTAPIQVIGSVPDVPNVHWRWKRLLSRRSWFIRQNAQGNGWEVTQRSKRGAPPPPVDDTDTGDYNDDTRSPNGKIYIYDCSALAPAQGGATAIGDFVYEEKQFTYQVESDAGGSWQVVGTLDVGQKIIAKRIANTGTVANDFQGLENSNVIRVLDAQISDAEARAIVGGSLPITIDSAANN
jgi:hypothetical protein